MQAVGERAVLEGSGKLIHELRDIMTPAYLQEENLDRRGADAKCLRWAEPGTAETHPETTAAVATGQRETPLCRCRGERSSLSSGQAQAPQCSVGHSKDAQRAEGFEDAVTRAN